MRAPGSRPIPQRSTWDLSMKGHRPRQPSPSKTRAHRRLSFRGSGPTEHALMVCLESTHWPRGKKPPSRVVFDTKDSPGSFQKTATITTSAPSIQEPEVTMKGNVKEAPAAKIKATPRRIDLGPIAAGSVHKKELTIANQGGLPLKSGRSTEKRPRWSITTRRKTERCGSSPAKRETGDSIQAR